MKTEHKALNDLDYLSQQGFALVKQGPEDVQQLKKQITARVKTGSSGYFYIICLLMGVFLGLNLFYLIHDPAPEKIAFNKANELEQPALKKQMDEQLVMLDTVSIIKENFIKEKSPGKKNHEIASPATQLPLDSIEELLPKQIDLRALNKAELEQKKIRFIINSPVYYLHDLKISNYMVLYFKKNNYVPLNDLMADNTAYRAESGTHLKEAAVYYLHNEIDKAMLLFKKGKYDACLTTLNEVASYNKEDINCDFYRGMCCYYKKNYARAIDYLDLCIANPNNAFTQEAEYYKALSHYEMGDKPKALIIFKQIAEDGEFYAEKALGFLSK